MKNFEFCQENSIFWYFVGYNIQEYYGQKIDFSEFGSVCKKSTERNIFITEFIATAVGKKKWSQFTSFFYKFEEKALL